MDLIIQVFYCNTLIKINFSKKKFNTIPGRKFDKYGNYRQWWSNNTIETFEKNTECFVKQYDNYTLPNVDEHVSFTAYFFFKSVINILTKNFFYLKLDLISNGFDNNFFYQIQGTTTLGENLADNGGLNHAYSAYMNYVRKNKKEQKLPGFENFTHTQLFFIAFASVSTFL